MIYSLEIIDKILGARDKGMSQEEMCQHFNLSVGAIAGIIYRNKATEKLSNQKTVSQRSPTLPKLMHQISPKTDKSPKTKFFRTCQWIAGEPMADDKCKCGKPTNRVYCDEHQAKVHRQKETSK